MGLTTPFSLRTGLLILLAVQNSVTIICLHYSRTHYVSGKEVSKNETASADSGKGSVYTASTLILTMETIKFVITLAFLMAQFTCSLRQTAGVVFREIFCRPSDTILLIVPSFLYIVQDNLIIYALSFIDAATYQVTFQLRILTTAFFAKVMLKKQLTCKHWIALVLLMIGVILAQVRFDDPNSQLSFRSETNDSTYLLGLLAIVCSTLTSGFAGVYNEVVMKNGQQPLLFVRSLQINIFAIIFAALAVIIKDGQRVTRLGFFHGYDSFIFFVALIQACGGITVAAIIKYADNILKTFATAISIILSCVLSYFLLGDLNLAPTFLLGTAIILYATYLYCVNGVGQPQNKALEPLSINKL